MPFCGGYPCTWQDREAPRELLPQTGLQKVAAQLQGRAEGAPGSAWPHCTLQGAEALYQLRLAEGLLNREQATRELFS